MSVQPQIYVRRHRESVRSASGIRQPLSPESCWHGTNKNITRFFSSLRMYFFREAWTVLVFMTFQNIDSLPDNYLRLPVSIYYLVPRFEIMPRRFWFMIPRQTKKRRRWTSLWVLFATHLVCSASRISANTCCFWAPVRSVSMRITVTLTMESRQRERFIFNNVVFSHSEARFRTIDLTCSIGCGIGSYNRSMNTVQLTSDRIRIKFFTCKYHLTGFQVLQFSGSHKACTHLDALGVLFGGLLGNGHTCAHVQTQSFLVGKEAIVNLISVSCH